MGLTERHWFEDEEPELTERQLEGIVYEMDKAYKSGYIKGYSDASQRQKGHWVFGCSNGHSWMKCSQCLVSQDGQTACFPFCPNCGASMEKEPEHIDMGRG